MIDMIPTGEGHFHSTLDGGFDGTSFATRLTPQTQFHIFLETLSRNLWSRWYQKIVSRIKASIYLLLVIPTRFVFTALDNEEYTNIWTILCKSKQSQLEHITFSWINLKKPSKAKAITYQFCMRRRSLSALHKNNIITVNLHKVYIETHRLAIIPSLLVAAL